MKLAAEALAKAWLIENICEPLGRDLAGVLNDAREHAQSGKVRVTQGSDYNPDYPDGIDPRWMGNIDGDPDGMQISAERFWESVSILDPSIKTDRDTIPYECCI